jgi:hypothetical protein
MLRLLETINHRAVDSPYISDPGAFPNNSLENIAKTTLGKLMMTKLGSISRDAFPHRLDGMTDGVKIGCGRFSWPLDGMAVNITRHSIRAKREMEPSFASAAGDDQSPRGGFAKYFRPGCLPQQ